MLKVHIGSFSYQNRPILEDVSFQVAKGEHLSIMGESGSGKSTLLKLIYGLLHLNSGTIFWNREQLLGPNYNLVPGESFIKYLSQDFDLMPFTTVTDNIGQHLSVFEQEKHPERIQELLELIEMTSFAKTLVKDLSGGQQQRVALARALAQQPKILLLDEPFAHIDVFRRNALRRKIFSYTKASSISVLNASHNPEDVLSYADRVLILKEGRLNAIGKTRKLYQSPPDKYTASLFGEVNQIPLSLLNPRADSNTFILVYPHEFKVSKVSGFPVRINQLFFQGSHYLIAGITEKNQTIHFNSRRKILIDDIVYLTIDVKTTNSRLL
ncbi:MAG: ABC transporter ATP-binding protein [Flavobacteriaceae bacterium]